MKTIKHILSVVLMGVALASCDDLFEPAQENLKDVSSMYGDASYAQGILGNAYILLPYSNSPQTDLATDDAVSNDQTNSYLQMATGAWSSQNDPTSQWKNRLNAIQMIQQLPFDMRFLHNIINEGLFPFCLQFSLVREVPHPLGNPCTVIHHHSTPSSLCIL